jgi:hypothetical protein
MRAAAAAARRRVAERRTAEAAARRVEGMMRAAHARTLLRSEVHFAAARARLMTAMGVRMRIHGKVKGWKQDARRRRERAALNLIIQQVRVSFHESTFRRRRRAAAKIQCWWFHAYVFRFLLRVWFEETNRHVLNGRVAQLQRMVACSDPAYARLRVFPNLVNSKDRVYGTSLLHTAVVADQNRRRMAHFLFSCGARLGETDAIGETALHKSVTLGDGENGRLEQLKTSMFIVDYARKQGENTRLILNLRNEDDENCADVCITRTDAEDHARTLMWLLESGAEINPDYEQLAEEEVQAHLKREGEVASEQAQFREMMLGVQREARTFDDADARSDPVAGRGMTPGQRVAAARRATADPENWAVKVRRGSVRYVNTVTGEVKASAPAGLDVETSKERRAAAASLLAPARRTSLATRGRVPSMRPPPRRSLAGPAALAGPRSGGAPPDPAAAVARAAAALSLGGLGGRRSSFEAFPSLVAGAVVSPSGRAGWAPARDAASAVRRENRNFDDSEDEGPLLDANGVDDLGRPVKVPTPQDADPRARKKKLWEKGVHRMLEQRADRLWPKVEGKEGLWLMRGVLAMRQIASEPTKRGYYYKDGATPPQTFGPFRFDLMRYWFEHKNFSLKTPIRFGDHGLFATIHETFPDPCESFPSSNTPRADLECAFAANMGITDDTSFAGEIDRGRA